MTHQLEQESQRGVRKPLTPQRSGFKTSPPPSIRPADVSLSKTLDPSQLGCTGGREWHINIVVPYTFWSALHHNPLRFPWCIRENCEEQTGEARNEMAHIVSMPFPAT